MTPRSASVSIATKKRCARIYFYAPGVALLHIAVNYVITLTGQTISIPVNVSLDPKPVEGMEDESACRRTCSLSRCMLT